MPEGRAKKSFVDTANVPNVDMRILSVLLKNCALLLAVNGIQSME